MQDLNQVEDPLRKKSALFDLSARCVDNIWRDKFDRDGSIKAEQYF